MDLLTHLRTKLAIYRERPLYVAYSGGLDSQVLLHGCIQLRDQYEELDLHAIHVNHGLSNNADAWVSHCKQYCAHFKVLLQTVNVDVEPAPRQSIEALARDARYAAFKQYLPENAVLLLAQHADDQLETILLQLKRGSGPKGLSAMPEVQNWSAGRVAFRPLLSVTREEIHAFARQCQLTWQEDESNQDARFDRNFIRLHVLPVLRERWPSFAQTAARSASLCAEQQSLLDGVTHQYLDDLRDERNSLNCSRLTSYSSEWRRQLVRTWLTHFDCPLPPQQILSRLNELLEAKPDADPILQWGQWQLRRYRQRLYLVDSRQLEPFEAVTLYHLDSVKILGGRFVLSRLQVELEPGLNQALLSTEQTEMFVEKPDNGGVVSLRKWMKIRAIPPWLRPVLPVITTDQRVIAVIDEHGSVVNTGNLDLNRYLKVAAYN